MTKNTIIVKHVFTERNFKEELNLVSCKTIFLSIQKLYHGNCLQQYTILEPVKEFYCIQAQNILYLINSTGFLTDSFSYHLNDRMLSLFENFWVIFRDNVKNPPLHSSLLGNCKIDNFILIVPLGH